MVLTRSKQEMVLPGPPSRGTPKGRADAHLDADGGGALQRHRRVLLSVRNVSQGQCTSGRRENVSFATTKPPYKQVAETHQGSAAARRAPQSAASASHVHDREDPRLGAPVLPALQEVWESSTTCSLDRAVRYIRHNCLEEDEISAKALPTQPVALYTVFSRRNVWLHLEGCLLQLCPCLHR